MSPVPVVLAARLPPLATLNGPKLLLAPRARLPLKFSVLSVGGCVPGPSLPSSTA